MAEAHAIKLSPEQVSELSLVDLAYMILKQTNKPFNFPDLMAEVARLKGLTKEQVNGVIARLYTEINIDGRFLCIGSNVWGLKRWYPTDKEKVAGGGKKFVRKDLDEDDDDFYDEEEDSFDEEETEDDAFAAEYDDADEEEVEAGEEDFEEEEEEGAAEEGEAEETEEEDFDSYEEEDDF
ncbi:DNA-directed RNA polymerase subunit delta [Tumebacillus sp. ITR2]|uniref:Probable DNA-directed RNA polymerase subunit delta n=1 Tax=Tumebacillus amylolyticus TaxID=2801339 RepID=A0ABS1JFV1_9BACL|nr:DNA-directed RNA polymerase subunit delta [Tumebacillus amylolyticus]MBL0389127.1 DNA-directed RNA polymerase subunit delta [Tumebacillus amylolyticus]